MYEYSHNVNIEKRWSKILKIKDAFTSTVEKKRNLKEIKTSLEASAIIYFKDAEYKKIAESLDLSEVLMSSSVKISKSVDDSFLFTNEEKDIGVKISKVDGQKCPRCWKIFQVNKNLELCKRCNEVINGT